MSEIRTNQTEHFLEIILDRPQKHNSFTPILIDRLTEIFGSIDDGLRAVILRGEGPSFSAGADLEWMKSSASYSEQDNITDAAKLFDMFYAMQSCPVPLFTLVHGNVMGGGLGLVAVSDVVIAEENTRFAFSEVRLGLAPAVISPFVLDRSNPSMVSEWMLTGRRFSAKEAQHSGLVQFVGKESELDGFRTRFERSMLASGPQALRATKTLLNKYKENPSLAERKRYTTKIIAECRTSEEGQEGLSSFFQKRTPKWKVES